MQGGREQEWGQRWIDETSRWHIWKIKNNQEERRRKENRHLAWLLPSRCVFRWPKTRWRPVSSRSVTAKGKALIKLGFQATLLKTSCCLSFFLLKTWEDRVVHDLCRQRRTLSTRPSLELHTETSARINSGQRGRTNWGLGSAAPWPLMCLKCHGSYSDPLSHDSR